VSLTLAVHGVGLSSSLGGAAQACAAARARLSRSRPLLDPPRFDAEGNPDPIVAHIVPEVGDGFQGTGRLVMLAQRAAADLRRNLPDLGARVGLFLVTSDYRLRDSEAIAAGALTSEDSDDGPDHAAIARAIVQTLGVPMITTEHVVQGPIGLGEALSRAGEALARRTIDLAIIGAIDSLVDEASIDWLTAAGRLKSARHSDGVMPGEAAAFVALAREGDAGKTYAFTIHAQVESPRPAWRSPAPRAVPDGLRAVLVDVAGQTPLWLFSDLNGEPFRFAQLAAARTFLAQQGRLVTAEETPAAAFGDTGACSGFLALLFFLHGHARGSAKAESGLMICASDTGGRMSLLMQRIGRG